MTAVPAGPVPRARACIAALRASHRRLSSLVSELDVAGLEAPSYDDDWSVGQVLSHVGSQAEIFHLFLEAGLGRRPAPGSEVFQPIWDVWNAKSPLEWRDDCVAAVEREVSTYESLDDAAIEAFRLELFGTEVDVAGLARMRVAEHAVHTWDVAVMTDPAATVAADAVDLLVDGLGATAARAGRPLGTSFRVRVGTSAPQRDLVVSVGESVTIDPAEPDDSYDGSVDLPAEAFLRLVYGRLDPDHTPEHDESGARGLGDLRSVLPGF